jgi:probable HAF family extracellular repeat protein
MRVRIIAYALLAMVLLSAGAGYAQYTVKDLGTLGGAESWAYDINDAGQVVGASLTSTRSMAPFIWASTTGMKSLSKMPNTTVLTGCANAINKTGQVTGWAYNRYGASRPFRWSASAGMTEITDGIIGWGINNSGTVVGEAAVVNAHWMGFMSVAGKAIKYIGSLNAGSGNVVYDINTAGLMTGYTQERVGPCRPMVWGSDGFPKQLSVLQGYGGAAYGINTNGETVGTSGGHAVLWNKYYYIKDLGTLVAGGSSQANDINDSGKVVGACYTYGSTARKYAFVWDATAGMKQLAIPTTFISAEAWAINTTGQIAGVAWDKLGNRHAIMWDNKSSGGSGSGGGGIIIPGR